MRNLVVMVCLFSVTLTGCASRRPDFVPAGMDRTELTASIARQAGPLQPGEQLIETPSPPLSKLDKATQKTMYYLAVGGLCVAAVGVCALLLYAQGRTHDPLDL